MRIHELKSWPEAFAPVVQGEKRSEYRYARDRNFARGDLLLLREWDPQSTIYSGEAAVVRITHIDRGPAWGIPALSAMLSIDLIDAGAEAEMRELVDRELEALAERFDGEREANGLPFRTAPAPAAAE